MLLAQHVQDESISSALAAQGSIAQLKISLWKMGNWAFGIQQCRTSRDLQVKAIPSYGLAVLGWWICPILWVHGEDMVLSLCWQQSAAPGRWDPN